MIAGLLLAAGRSTRFGAEKLLAPLWGRPVLWWSAESIAREVDELVVVVPERDTAIRAALNGVSARFVENARRGDGMASSIAAGVAALPACCEAAIIALGDQPVIGARVVSSLITRWRDGRPAAVVPEYDDGRGHPVLFDRRCFAQLLALHGDAGARSVLEARGPEVARVRVAGVAPADVDTPELLARLARSSRPGS